MQYNIAFKSRPSCKKLIIKLQKKIYILKQTTITNIIEKKKCCIIKSNIFNASSSANCAVSNIYNVSTCHISTLQLHPYIHMSILVKFENISTHSIQKKRKIKKHAISAVRSNHYQSHLQVFKTKLNASLFPCNHISNLFPAYSKGSHSTLHFFKVLSSARLSLKIEGELQQQRYSYASSCS